MCLCLKCWVYLLYLLVLLWEWSFGQDGLIKLSGTLLYGICKSLTTDSEKVHSSLTMD
ncbi:unnamed protein product [Prunus brigantina]